MNPLLEVKDLKKHFKTKKGTVHAVDGVSFQLSKGKTLGVVGESGCGKSTLGRVVVHLLDSTDGNIYFEGQDITDVSKKELKNLRREMQMVFQDPFSSLNPRKTISETIAEPLQIYKICKNNKELSQRLANLMDTVGLEKRLKDAYPHELDGGKRQRVGVGRALALDPKFIVCDEPVSALDVSIQAQILNLLQDIQDEKGLTYIFITHDLSVVKHMSERISVMYLGKIVENAPADEIFENPLHPYTKALISAIPIPQVNIERNKITIKGEVSSPLDPEPGCRFAPRCPYAEDFCLEKSPDLEEVLEDHIVACYRVREINKLG